MIIHYVSGSRADFGLMARCLSHIQASARHEVGVVATGQHTVARYGRTLGDIHAAGLPIVGEIPVTLSGESGSEMGHALADELTGFLKLWSRQRPDLVLLLGDRGEMVAGALAAVHLGIHVAHLHGGERTGTLDESFRHVITKLSHLHFPATEDAAKRIRKMGEAPETVHVIGAPGLVGVAGRAPAKGAVLKAELDLSSALPLALCVFHPVVQEAGEAAKQMQVVVEATRGAGYAMAVLRPNSDAGGDAIDAVLDTMPNGPEFRVLTHLRRDTYLDLLSVSDLMIGNSSSGIIESASFAVPCVNIGTRQNDRQRNANTFDCQGITPAQVTAAIRSAEGWPRDDDNVYGDGKTDTRLLGLLDTLDLGPDLLFKRLMF
ncbi:UDP-N-acetylglucosamine 2-epimerase [Roseovarius nanhaiticus]|uniref:UDP-N-acetylglucosamine 2-epimerase n=1 Tax=Roseovarius nanhaiticus TaxID=573024 RepID=UPI002491BF4C|nr:UDP-N-acetylglucosamine 2-epimerase [Roseovarius nanhaiticus]